MEYKDYYSILGVKKGASAEDIKRAYRRLAKEHHPDLQGEAHKAKAGEKFKEINEAYEVLSDPEKRAKYDAVGPEWANAARHEAPRPRSGGRAEQFSGFSDFFEELFGGAGRRGFGVSDAYATEPETGRDIEAELPLSLEDAFAGGDKKISMAVPALCPACGGSGRAGRSFCRTCGGVGETQRQKSITVHLPKYVGDGVKLRLRGQGSPGAGAREAGDLFLRVKLLAHPRFKVSGSDVETTITLAPSTAALGGEAELSTLESSLRIRIPAGTHAGRTFRVPGKGLSKGGGARGDLYAVARIDIAERLSDQARKLYEQLREAGG
ncbi:MAG TPA: J domain-containing protein [Elusimicrobiota bacterium]|nr:J domain-containing protein [Elusimicrobiota bacterium]